MSVDSLEETQGDPKVDIADVQIPHEVAVQQRAQDSSSAEDKHFSRVSIFCSEPERCRVFMVDLVDVLI